MSILKKSSLFTFVLALIMVMAMSVTAFGAEVPVDQESANAAATAESVTTNDNEADSTVTGLTGAKFVKANGNNYPLNMGTDVIISAVQEGNTVTIYLKPAKKLGFTGRIIEAYYPGENINKVVDNASAYYMTLDASRVVNFTSGKWGINLDKIKFAFSPFRPPGMPNPVRNSYFICDQFVPAS